MSDDDAPACTEHLWQLVAVSFGEGALTEYSCSRCGVLMLVGPGQDYPGTA